jgi:threonine dehydratase
MYDSLRAGQRVTLERVGIFADGVAVRRVGEETFRTGATLRRRDAAGRHRSRSAPAIQDIFEDTRSIVEPSGALALAGLKKYVAREQPRAQRLVAINSGANMNFDRLRHIAERAEIGAQREALLAVEIPERPAASCASARRSASAASPSSITATRTARVRSIFVGFALRRSRRGAMRW